jgi:hypothetical protein
MIRTEILIVGCILILVGIGLCIVGHNKMQPTFTDQALTFIEQLSGEKRPADLIPNKNEAYVFLAGGGLSFALGLVMILKSRTIQSDTEFKEKGKIT